jgi:hypothetical protein
MRSQKSILHLIRMSEASLVVAGVRVGVCGNSTTITRLNSDARGNTIVPSSVFFPCLARTLCITRIGDSAFQSAPILSITILRHVQILCFQCLFNSCPFSSISFETNSELTGIASKTFGICFSHINHNSSPCSNLLVIMLFRLQKTFIDFF